MSCRVVSCCGMEWSEVYSDVSYLRVSISEVCGSRTYVVQREREGA